ncbi:RluA family pseudouridine synthase [bacterium]|nr:RluA family pseudouridine synthase [bacterium]
MKLNIITTENNSGERIDKFLAGLAKKKNNLPALKFPPALLKLRGASRQAILNNLSRADFARAIKNGKILVNNKKVKLSYILREKDEVSITHKALSLPAGRQGIKNQKALLPNSKIKFEVLYKDKNIIVIDKPAGLLTHPDFKERKNTLVNGLIAKFPEIIGVGDKSNDSWTRPGIVHRLDKDTSGVMVIARNQKSFDELKELFKNRKIKKKYLAVVYGKLKNKSGVIEKPIARSGNYKKQVIAGLKTKTKIREAITEYKVLKEFKNYSLVEARLITGRTHQIRIHFFSLGHPVVGDKIYKIKNKLKFKQIDAERQLLHAGQIQFELLGKKYLFSSPLPSDFDEFYANFP